MKLTLAQLDRSYVIHGVHITENGCCLLDQTPAPEITGWALLERVRLARIDIARKEKAIANMLAAFEKAERKDETTT